MARQTSPESGDTVSSKARLIAHEFQSDIEPTCKTLQRMERLPFSTALSKRPYEKLIRHKKRTILNALTLAS